MEILMGGRDFECLSEKENGRKERLNIACEMQIYY